ncbi:TPA: Shedu immune nuclease family protein [Vibrio metoecus]
MSNFDDIFGDVFDEIFGDTSKIAKDLKLATQVNKDKIGRAITTKLKFSYYTELVDFFDSAINEIKLFAHEEMDTLKKGLEVSNSKELIRALESNSELEKLVRDCASWVKKLEELKTELEEENLDNNELGIVLLDCVTFLCQIRVKHDIIPLVKRGLYADKIRKAISIWREKSESSDQGDERYWQEELFKNKEVLEHLFGAKVVFVGEQFSAGGMNALGKGEKYVDFAFEGESTNNLVFVEIKKPSTQLLVNSEYRGGVYPFSTELSGAVTQVLTQRNQIMKTFYQKRMETKDSTFEVHQPRCYVIAGNLATIKDHSDKCRSFELSRSAVEPNVTIKTFDELYSSFIAFNEANEI